MCFIGPGPSPSSLTPLSHSSLQNDFDFVLHLDSTDKETLVSVRSVLLQTLQAMLPEETNMQGMDEYSAGEVLLRNQFMVHESGGDSWALYTIAGAEDDPSIGG